MYRLMDEIGHVKNMMKKACEDCEKMFMFYELMNYSLCSR